MSTNTKKQTRRFARIRSTSTVLAVLLLVAVPAALGSTELSDEAITSAVDDEIAEDRATPADEIDVATIEGVVTLTGSVHHILAKDRAEKLASTVKGVRAVVNRIEVRPTRRTDLELADDVRNALLRDPATESWKIDVSAEDGVVTLTGTVASYQERELAATLAKGVRGVRDLVDDIRIDVVRDRRDAEIRREIEAALRWNAWIDGAAIDVAVEDGEVRLTGVVGSLVEKNRAQAEAWVAGTRSVDGSGLEVSYWARDPRLRKSKYEVMSDDDVRDAVKDALLYDPRVHSFEIDVEPDAGYVTLRGNVSHLDAKRAAAEDARSVVGVWGVDNKIKVRPVSSAEDAEIEQAVEEALLRDPYVDRYEIDVTVADGHVLLDGDVASTFEKARADHVAGRQIGVVDVHNLLTVHDTVIDGVHPRIDPWRVYDYDWYANPTKTVATKPDWRIERDIENELFWSPFVDGNDVRVEVDHGVATLTGTVETWSEREAARENAFEGGAIVVDNDLAVVYGPERERR